MPRCIIAAYSGFNDCLSWMLPRYAQLRYTQPWLALPFSSVSCISLFILFRSIESKLPPDPWKLQINWFYQHAACSRIWCQQFNRLSLQHELIHVLYNLIAFLQLYSIVSQDSYSILTLLATRGTATLWIIPRSSHNVLGEDRWTKQSKIIYTSKQPRTSNRLDCWDVSVSERLGKWDTTAVDIDNHDPSARKAHTATSKRDSLLYIWATYITFTFWWSHLYTEAACFVDVRQTTCFRGFTMAANALPANVNRQCLQEYRDLGADRKASWKEWSWIRTFCFWIKKSGGS